MDRNWHQGTWLLLDAAGPETLIGLLQEGSWLDYISTGKTFLESCQASVEQLIDDNDLSLDDLSGVLYASGPGSTLGLRLAAMFIRTLLKLPHLKHWKCLQYNNLALAATSVLEDSLELPVQAVAPWRRDRIHRVTISKTSPLDFVSDALHPDELDSEKSTLFLLGNRPRNLPVTSNSSKLDAARIPTLLSSYPELLELSAEPIPFVAESPEFARWSPKRHSIR